MGRRTSRRSTAASPSSRRRSTCCGGAADAARARRSTPARDQFDLRFDGLTAESEVAGADRARPDERAAAVAVERVRPQAAGAGRSRPESGAWPRSVHHRSHATMRQCPPPARAFPHHGRIVDRSARCGLVGDRLPRRGMLLHRDEERDVRDLRLAHGILTTRWSRRPGGLRRAPSAHAVLLALHRAYGAHRLRRRGRLDHAALLEGAAALIGDWFRRPGATTPARQRHCRACRRSRSATPSRPRRGWRAPHWAS